jgi:AAA domain, putative AbiEii toxin, Type IV TA system
LLMLKQTLDVTYDPGPLKIDGPNVTFTSSDQFLSRSMESPPQLRVAIARASFVFELIFVPGGHGSMDLFEQAVFNGELWCRLRPGMSSSEIARAIDGAFVVPPLPGMHLTLVRDRFLLSVEGGIIKFRLAGNFEAQIRRLIHVPSLRSERSRAYPVGGVGPDFQGTFDHHYVAGVLAHWQSAGKSDAEEINIDLHRLGLTQQITARRVTAAAIELEVSRLAKGDPDDKVNIADVGSGVSQVFPVLVALRVAEEGRLVYLEEPEIDLHPRAQTKLAEVLADAAKRGVRVVAETHSSLLLTAVQTLVAKGELSPDLVKLHWFQRDPETGNTRISSADLDENGAFGDWPEDFGAVALDAEGGYLDAVEGRRVS